MRRALVPPLVFGALRCKEPAHNRLVVVNYPKTVKQKPKILDAPMAFTSGGEVLVNIAHLTFNPEILAAVGALLEVVDADIYVGIAIPGRLRRVVRRDVRDACVDVVGRLGPALTLGKPRPGSSP
jgi:hypothetical protein